MQGIELSRKYYELYGVPMIEALGGDWAQRIACGIVGNGSECYGCDDEVSQDHDFEAGFAMWLTREDEAEIGFKLMRAYSKLPDCMDDVKKRADSYYGNHKFGVWIIEDFYEKQMGMNHPPQNWREWLRLPDEAVSTAVNGEVFRDDLGKFTAFREHLLHGCPEDVWKKKIASNLAFMAQAGQYNYARCLEHGEAGAAQMALYEFVKNAVSVVYALNRTWRPYYKWQFRLMRNLPKLTDVASELETMICGNLAMNLVLGPGGTSGPAYVDTQSYMLPRIERICARIVEELHEQDLSRIGDPYLEHQAHDVMSRIGNREIRALHVME